MRSRWNSRKNSKAHRSSTPEKRIPFLSRLNTELELSEQQLALNELRRRLDVDTAELISLIGLDPLAQVALSQPLLDDDVTLEAAVELALTNNLDLRDLQGDIVRQERLAAETIWNRFPRTSPLKHAIKISTCCWNNINPVLGARGQTWGRKGTL